MPLDMRCRISFPVRPLAGAGIEISQFSAAASPGRFAPSRGRELKFSAVPSVLHRGLFAPSRGRELKYSAVGGSGRSIQVRPLAGAGIEITVTLMSL